MNNREFELLFENQVQKCRDVLVQKAAEYASDVDRMHNFKISGHLNNQTAEQALWGFLTKHIISLADMVSSGKEYPAGVWDEKLGDFLNYGFLLRALLVESYPDEEQLELFQILEDEQASQQPNLTTNHVNLYLNPNS